MVDSKSYLASYTNSIGTCNKGHIVKGNYKHPTKGWVDTAIKMVDISPSDLDIYIKKLKNTQLNHY